MLRVDADWSRGGGTCFTHLDASEELEVTGPSPTQRTSGSPCPLPNTHRHTPGPFAIQLLTPRLLHPLLKVPSGELGGFVLVFLTEE